MSKKFDIISMILIVTLTVILVAFVFNYFTKSASDELSPVNSELSIVDTSIVENVSGSNTLITSTPVLDDEEKHPSSESTIISNIEQNAEVFIKVDEKSGDGIIKDVYTAPDSNELSNEGTTPLIITSNDNVSDKEKKEVLNELDETLMDLLDVIENVQTVDESRLPSEGSGVQP